MGSILPRNGASIEPRAIQLEDRGVAIVDADRDQNPEFDLISGLAGEVVGLLSLQLLTGHTRFLERAIRAGKSLMEAADKAGPGWSWRSPAAPRQQALAGYSHGASGPAHAFTELFAATGEAHFAAAAIEAMRYEKHLFSRAVQNWPDLRRDPRLGDEVDHRFSTFWCHGAPGIALSRLRAYAVLGDRCVLDEANLALETTAKSLSLEVTSRAANFSLCHGLAGNAAILDLAADQLGSHAESYRTACRRAADVGLQTFMKTNVWPCGTRGGSTPSLMLGLSGIGLFYLRLSGHYMPCPLMYSPDTLRGLIR